MPRDPSGNYSLPALGNPAVTNTPITIAWWNGTSTDMATAFTDSLSRSGLGGMLVPFKLVDGTAGAPAFSFQSEPTTGLYLAAPGEMDVSVGGTRYSRWTSAGFQESFDNGATWKNPLYNNNGDQTFTGGLDFTATKLTIGGTAVRFTTLAHSAASTGAYSAAANAAYTAIPNATVTYTSLGNGRPVLVQLGPDGLGSASWFGAADAFSGGVTVTFALSADGGSTFFGDQSFMVGQAGPGTRSTFPSTAFSVWVGLSAGSKTLALYAKGNGAGTTLYVTQCILNATVFS